MCEKKSLTQCRLRKSGLLTQLFHHIRVGVVQRLDFAFWKWKRYFWPSYFCGFTYFFCVMWLECRKVAKTYWNNFETPSSAPCPVHPWQNWWPVRRDRIGQSVRCGGCSCRSRAWSRESAAGQSSPPNSPTGHQCLFVKKSRVESRTSRYLSICLVVLGQIDGKKQFKWNY